MTELRSGAVTFLFTDIEGSSRLWEADPERMADALARHDKLCRTTVVAHGGQLVKMVGDGLHAVFGDPAAAVATALDLQRGMAVIAAMIGIPFKMRCGVHAGLSQARDGDYFGTAVNRAARVMNAAHGGQILLTQAVVELGKGRFPAGTDLLHLGHVRLRDLAETENIWQLRHADLVDVFPALRSLDETPNNLPQPLTSFIGREREMAQIRTLLEQSRLLTLMGPGGCGKSRTALQVATELLPLYPDGVWLVELAALAHPELVPHAVANTFGVKEEQGKRLTQTVVESLTRRRLLLLLDNAEHLTDACAELCRALLQSASGVRILVTSREPLHLAGEQTYVLPALSVPGEDANAGRFMDGIERYDAVRLFVDRIRLHNLHFALTRDNALLVARICRRLDGIPLAIELAAARARSLTLGDIHARLADRFSLLTGGNHGALPRQQTLSALIAWSFDLLSSAERCLLERISVFAGGFDLAAVENVCAAVPLSPPDILDLLSSLVDKSLVIAEPQGDVMRYRQLESIVEFARARHEHGDAADTRARHGRWCLNLVRQAHPELVGPAQGQWSARLETEHGNLRGALAWSLSDATAAGIALELGALLYRFWHLRGHLSEGRQHVRAALALPAAPRAGNLHADALYAGGVLAYYQSDLAEAKAMLGESLAARREHGSARDIAAALSGLANVLQAEDDTATARDYQEQALALFREIGNRTGEGICLINLGSLCMRHADYEAARGYAELAADLGRSTGHGALEGMSESNLGEIAEFQGDLAGAMARFSTAHAIAKRIGDPTLEAMSVAALGHLAVCRGDVATARAFESEGLAAMRGLGIKSQTLAALENAAYLLFVCGSANGALHVLAATASARESLALPPSAAEAQRRDRTLASLRDALDEATYTSLWEAGKSQPLDSAIDFALAQMVAIAVDPGRPTDSAIIAR